MKTLALCLLAALVSGVAGLALAAEHVVDIRDSKFVPEISRIKTGDTVRWINQERRTSHSILFLGAGGFESERFFPGDSWQRTFDKPGRYEHSCGPHPEMKGVVEVE